MEMWFDPNSIQSINNFSSSNTSSSGETGLNKTLDKDAFLKLLIAELQNQNPLEPMNNQDFVAQMAQFTTMEQMTNMTTSLEDFLGNMNATLRLQASSVVGKYAVIEGRDLSLEDGYADPIVFSVENPGEVTIEIRNEQGNVVFEENLGMLEGGIHSYTWDGRDSSGVAQSDGNYTYHLSSIGEGGEEVEFGGVTGGIVQAVQFVGGEIYVLIDNQKYNFSDIIEISNPSEETTEEA